MRVSILNGGFVAVSHDAPKAELVATIAALHAENAELRRAYADCLLDLCDRVWRPISAPPPCPMRVLLLIPTAFDPEWPGADYGIIAAYYHGADHPTPWADQGNNHNVFEEWCDPHFPTHWQPISMPDLSKLGAQP